MRKMPQGEFIHSPAPLPGWKESQARTPFDPFKDYKVSCGREDQDCFPQGSPFQRMTDGDSAYPAWSKLPRD